MQSDEAIRTIRTSCNAISAELTRLHPAVGNLGQKEIQDEMVKAIFQLTKDLETVKKLLKRIENQS
jgi:hypothetical protein